MITASTVKPPSSASRTFVVRPLSASERTFSCSDVTLKAEARSARTAAGRSCISPKSVTPRASQARTWAPRYAGWSRAASQALSAPGASDDSEGRGETATTWLRYLRLAGHQARAYRVRASAADGGRPRHQSTRPRPGPDPDRAHSPRHDRLRVDQGPARAGDTLRIRAAARAPR